MIQEIAVVLAMVSLAMESEDALVFGMTTDEFFFNVGFYGTLFCAVMFVLWIVYRAFNGKKISKLTKRRKGKEKEGEEE